LFTLIDTHQDLALLNEELLNRPYIGVDTEFRRTNKFNMRLALLQINDGEEVYLIDAICIKDPEDKAEFLFSTKVKKIFHSCREDLDAIYSWTFEKVNNIFDTQLANSFLHDKYSISYQDLVEQELGISLRKDETRSNWTKRPLSESQLKYASLDVEYLPYLYNKQKQELNNTNKLAWHDQDAEQILEIAFNAYGPIENYTRLLSKSEEENLLTKFSMKVDEIASREKINNTLFFSKKAQKEFLRMAITVGLEQALDKLTSWRLELIKEDIKYLVE